MPIFLLTLLKNVHFYIYVAFLSVIGTLWFINGSHVRKIENQAETIVEMETENIRLDRRLARQNDEVEKLKKESEKLQARVDGNILIIETLDEHGNKVLMELDEQAIPAEHRGALMWMIQKSMEELGQ